MSSLDSDIAALRASAIGHRIFLQRRSRLPGLGSVRLGTGIIQHTIGHGLKQFGGVLRQGSGIDAGLGRLRNLLLLRLIDLLAQCPAGPDESRHHGQCDDRHSRDDDNEQLAMR